MGLRDYTLFDIISRNARLHAQRTAIVFEGKRITHREYLGRVERLAAGSATRRSSRAAAGGPAGSSSPPAAA